MNTHKKTTGIKKKMKKNVKERNEKTNGIVARRQPEQNDKDNCDVEIYGYYLN